MGGDEEEPRILPEAVHSCVAGEHLYRDTDAAQAAEAIESLWGHAITHVERAAGRWWAHNEEYSSLIRFCPWCGVNLDREVAE